MSELRKQVLLLLFYTWHGTWSLLLCRRGDERAAQAGAVVVVSYVARHVVSVGVISLLLCRGIVVIPLLLCWQVQRQDSTGRRSIMQVLERDHNNNSAQQQLSTTTTGPRPRRGAARPRDARRATTSGGGPSSAAVRRWRDGAGLVLLC